MSDCTVIWSLSCLQIRQFQDPLPMTEVDFVCRETLWFPYDRRCLRYFGYEFRCYSTATLLLLLSRMMITVV